LTLGITIYNLIATTLRSIIE